MTLLIFSFFKGDWVRLKNFEFQTKIIKNFEFQTKCYFLKIFKNLWLINYYRKHTNL